MDLRISMHWLITHSTIAASLLLSSRAVDMSLTMIPLSLIVVVVEIYGKHSHLVGIGDANVAIADVLASSSLTLSRSGSVS